TTRASSARRSAAATRNGCRIEIADAPWILPRKAGEVARPKDQGARRRGQQRRALARGPSTMLRVVPLPRDAGEDQPEAPTRRRRGSASLRAAGRGGRSAFRLLPTSRAPVSSS